MRITLDTNVLVSGTFWTGNSFRVLDLIDKKVVSCVLSEPILQEYLKVIQSDEIMRKKEAKSLRINDVIRKVIAMMDIVHPKTSINVVKEDPDDNKILECAIEGSADCIITQDNHLLKLGRFRKIDIITPEEFLLRIGKY